LRKQGPVGIAARHNFVPGEPSTTTKFVLFRVLLAALSLTLVPEERVSRIYPG